MDIQGRVALVVGGASGIGFATAKILLQAGAQVSVADISKASGETVVKELQREFGISEVIFVHVDVADDDAFEAAFTTTKGHFQRLDILVNAAGVIMEKSWSYEVDVNMKGIIRGTLLAWKHMGQKRHSVGGMVVNIASIFALNPSAGVPVYTATKYAVLGWGRSTGMKFNYERTGVRVVTMCPGLTDTPLIKDNNSRCLSPEHVIEVTREAKEYCQTPENVASGILYVIKNGDSGSVWVVELNKPAYEIAFPEYPSMKVELM